MTSKPKTEALTERVQKVLARAGLGSRRKMEELIREQRVRINHKTAQLGASVGIGDRVETPGRIFEVQAGEEATRVIRMNKKVGVVCTRSDPEGRPTVFEALPRGRWLSIGRLDINTSGLLLLTNDGELAHAMMHPSHGVDREYACRIHGPVTESMLERLRSGVELDDGQAAFTDISPAGGEGENRWFHVALMEGRHREVRRLWESQNVRVSRLKRVRYGAVFLPSKLKMGQWEEMTPKDVKVLRSDVGLKPKAPPTLVLKPLRR